MTTFMTESGSVYEVDPDLPRIRRLAGLGNPLPRVGTDGVWRDYTDISPVEVGQSVMIVWSAEITSTTELGLDGEERAGILAKTTITSPVTEIRE